MTGGKSGNEIYSTECTEHESSILISSFIDVIDDVQSDQIL